MRPNATHVLVLDALQKSINSLKHSVMFNVCTGIDLYISYLATTVNLFPCEACGDIPYCGNAYRSKLLSYPENCTADS